jgi:hypothetical protein
MCCKKIITPVLLLFYVVIFAQTSTVPDPDQGLRASWMRGAWGALWLPEKCYNGNVEGVTIDDFLTQINDIRTIDYIQVGLTCPSIYSPVHTAPNDIIESLWEGDTNSNGYPLNLCVPRSTVADPFLSWLEAIYAVGLKSEVYVNSYNLLDRIPDSIPDDFSDVSARWKEYCDTNETVQAFIESSPYISDDDAENRKYMFCYAEFILKPYAIRYGELIDAWCFDSADNIMGSCGDDADSGVEDDQRIYQAFADAVHAGNPDAAVAFNNSVGTAAKPFATPTLFEDYSFGHPFGGAGDMVETTSLYDRNFGICEFMSGNEGLSFTNDSRDWNDNVVGHFFPKQSTTSWNSGSVGCLTDDQFVEWTSTGIINGGAITWGTPLVIVNLENSSPNLTLQSFALDQLTLADDYLKLYQSPEAPSWSRSRTILEDAIGGELYSHTLIKDFDFWDPQGTDVTISASNQDDLPSWLTITETESGDWVLSGTPTETTDTEYEFELIASDGSNETTRTMKLTVLEYAAAVASTIDVQIKATADTNYGTNTVATMYSDVQTASDGLATFRISIDVTPTTDKAIVSGESGGSSTSQSWGVGSDALFTGSDEEWVGTISNIQIVDFNANGGTLDSSDVSASFASITVVNAQSTNDSFSFKVNDLTMIPGKLDENTYTLDLNAETATNSITEFSIGTGNTSTANKWSVEGVTVSVEFNATSKLVDNETAIDLILYPNPASDVISFNMTPKKVCIYDMQGRRVKKDSSGATTIDVSGLEEAIYIVEFISEDGVTYYKKLVRKN